MMTVFRLVLLVGLVLCAIATALVKKPMQAVIIYMAYSVMMSVVWILLQSPDLAITEAAVGAGITSILFFLTLRRINLIDKDAEQSGEQRKEDPDDPAPTANSAATCGSGSPVSWISPSRCARPPRPRSSRLRAIARSAAKRPRAAASSTRRSSTACLRARCASFSRG